MNYHFINTWGLGDVIMTLPSILKLSNMYPRVHVYVRNNANKIIVDDLGVDNVTVYICKTNIDLLKCILKVRMLFGGGTLSGISNMANWKINLISKLSRLKLNSVQDKHKHRAINTFINVAGSDEDFTDYLETVKNISAIERNPVDYLIHPGSSVKHGIYKRLPREFVLKFVNNLVFNRRSFKLIFGPDDSDEYSYYQRQLGDHNLIFSNSFETLEKSMNSAITFIGGDSGVAHFASIVHPDVHVVFGPTNPRVSSPLGDNVHHHLPETRLRCSPCIGTKNYFDCPNEIVCMTQSIANLNKDFE